jgi:predicted metal-dependent hydrolase
MPQSRHRMQLAPTDNVRRTQQHRVIGVTLPDTPQDALSNSAPQDPHAFGRGIEQFNGGHFFEAHETWEAIWLQSPEPEKTFLQGIIQIAAAFHHHSRGNLRGAHSLLQAGLGRLARFPDVHRGIALGALRAEAQAWVVALAGGQLPVAEIAFPRIESAEND